MKKICSICNNEHNMGARNIIKVIDNEWVCRECIENANLSVLKASYMRKKDILARMDEKTRASYEERHPKIEKDTPKYTLEGDNGQLYVYENKVEITRKGVLAFAFQGLKGTKTIPISEIKSIQVKKGGFVQGYIQFGVAGGVENRKGAEDATRDENTVTFSRPQNGLVEEIKHYIENIMLNQTNNQNTVVQQTSAADEILKFKQLLDAGIITQEEFDTKKKQLLGL